MEENKKPEYQVPAVVTYTDEEILEELGPALTFYNNYGTGLPTKL